MRKLLLLVVRWLGETLVRLYYPRRDVTGEPVPPGPVIFVANHPNGLLDPLLVRVATRRPARFLAKKTLFANPFGRLAMDAFGCLPLARAQDVRAERATVALTASEADAQATRARVNEGTFARCREALLRGEAIALFPEGTSHSDPQMRPFKTGAARIALTAATTGDDGHPGAPLTIVPVGLSYDQKATFRSSALVTVGPSLDLAPFLTSFSRESHATVEALTEEIRRGLDRVVLQAHTAELLQGVTALARWTTPATTAAGRVARQVRAQALMEALGETADLDDAALAETPTGRPRARLRDAVARVRLYASTLRRLGVRNPWALEVELVTWRAALVAVGRLLGALPFAMAGALLGWVPYRLAGFVAKRITREDDVLGTVKLIAGFVFLVVAWTAEATALTWFAAHRADEWPTYAARGVPLAVVAPLALVALGIGGGYLALCVEEWARQARAALRYAVLRQRRPGTIARLVARRQALVDEVTDALEALDVPRNARGSGESARQATREGAEPAGPS